MSTADNPTTTITYLDRPPGGWFVLDVMRAKSRTRDWVALMIDVDPDDFRRSRSTQSAWVRVPGKHESREDAWEALEGAMATRH